MRTMFTFPWQVYIRGSKLYIFRRYYMSTCFVLRFTLASTYNNINVHLKDYNNRYFSVI